MKTMLVRRSAALLWVSLLISGAACADAAPPATSAPPVPTEGEPSSSPPADAAAPASPAPPASRPDARPTPEPPDADKDPAPPLGDTCVDNDDAGDTVILAKKVTDITDCDNPKTISGVSHGATDADYYRLRANDGWCQFKPIFEVGAAGTEVCAFARCLGTGEQAIAECTQGTLSVDDVGTYGCCAAGPGKAEPVINCSGANDSADVTIRVRQPTADACIPYVVTYAL